VIIWQCSKVIHVATFHRDSNTSWHDQDTTHALTQRPFSIQLLKEADLRCFEHFVNSTTTFQGLSILTITVVDYNDRSCRSLGVSALEDQTIINENSCLGRRPP
jgi:hypothetical protein